MCACVCGGGGGGAGGGGGVIFCKTGQNFDIEGKILKCEFVYVINRK